LGDLTYGWVSLDTGLIHVTTAIRTLKRRTYGAGSIYRRETLLNQSEQIHKGLGYNRSAENLKRQRLYEVSRLPDSPKRFMKRTNNHRHEPERNRRGKVDRQEIINMVRAELEYVVETIRDGDTVDCHERAIQIANRISTNPRPLAGKDKQNSA
jgi:hypothetical protein